MTGSFVILRILTRHMHMFDTCSCMLKYLETLDWELNYDEGHVDFAGSS